jgi:hypothetical protein
MCTGSSPVTPSMKKYKLIGDIMLSFIFDNEQRDLRLRKGDGIIEHEGNTVWFITPEGKKYESITTANVIDVALRRKDIVEI